MKKTNATKDVSTPPVTVITYVSPLMLNVGRSTPKMSMRLNTLGKFKSRTPFESRYGTVLPLFRCCIDFTFFKLAL